MHMGSILLPSNRWHVKSLAAVLCIGALCLAALPGRAPAAEPATPLVRLGNADADPENEVIVENRFYRMVLKPSLGGTAVSFIAKPSGDDMVLPDPKRGMGLMNDILRDQGYGGEWQGPYDVEIRSAGPREGEVLLRRRGTGTPELQRLTLTKTLKVSADSPVIDLTVDLAFAPGDPPQYGVRYWMQNRVAHHEKRTHYYFPTAKGVESFDFIVYRGGTDAHQQMSLNPPRPWTAAVVDGGPGLAFVIGGDALEQLYSYGKNEVLTLEWGYAQSMLQRGQPWRVGCRFFPFANLPRVDGVLDGVAGALVTDAAPAPRNPLKGKVLLAGEPGDLTVELEWRRVPDPKWQSLTRQAARIEPVAEIPFELANPEAGTYVLRARVSRDGRALGAFERAFVAGKPSGRYVLQPENPRTDQLGPADSDGAISLKPDVPARVAKILPTDCRLVRGFTHAPVDGRTDTRAGEGTLAEWSGIHGVPAVTYDEVYGNNGLHITLPEGGCDAMLIRGGWQGRAYADIDSFLLPGPAVPALCEVRPRFGVFRASFTPATPARRISFFYTQPQGEPLADVSFLRIAPAGAPDASWDALTYALGDATDPDDAIHQALLDRFGSAYRAHVLAQTPGAKATLAKGEFLHLLTPPQDPKLGLAAVTFDLLITQAPPNALLTLRVQDVLDPRRECMGVDFRVPGPGRYRVTLDTPDQVFLPPKEEWKTPPRMELPIAPPPVLWTSLAADAPVSLDSVQLTLHRIPRERALVEAGAWRKFLLRGLFSSLSEPRAWMGLKDKQPVRKQFASHERMKRYELTLVEIFENAEIARLLLPDDDVVRQYHEALYQNMDRRKPLPPPVLPDVPGAPRWAVLARESWRLVRDIPDWWLDNRLLPGGYLGGGINDDTDMFQTWQCLPMIESEPLGKRLRDVAEQLSDSAWQFKLEEGINKRTTDVLHAYEEGINQLALCAWWFYGDPVHYERLMISARSTMKLMVETKDGRLHFGAVMLGIDQARNGYPTLGMSPEDPMCLLIHPLYEAALYNRHPAILARWQRWGDTWLAYQKPGAFVGKVDIVTGQPAGTSKSLAGPTDGWMALYHVTRDPKWLQPYKWAMDQEGNWGFYPGYGQLDEALIQWDTPYQQRMQKAFSEPRSGYAGFYLTKNRSCLDAWLSDSVSWYSRSGYINTCAEQKTDRVYTFNATTPIACYLGDAPNRNRWLRNTAVSYENLRGEDYAALVWDSTADNLRVALYNFRETPLSGLIRLWRLDHGRYRVRVGPDANDDGVMDTAATDRTAELQRYSAIPVTLPPKQVTIVQAEQIERLDDIRTRADLALSKREVTLNGRQLTAVAHNIGILPVADVQAAVLDADGKTVARQSLGELAAPLDLIPRTKSFTITLPSAPGRGWQLVLDPDNAVPEIYEGNNRIALDNLRPRQPSGEQP